MKGNPVGRPKVFLFKVKDGVLFSEKLRTVSVFARKVKDGVQFFG